jgi:hypothetical protein
MNALQKGLLLGAFQIALVASLGAKLAWDRVRLPRAWAKAGSYDPNLPIRGRYLTLQLEVKLDTPEESQGNNGTPQRKIPNYYRGILHVKDGQLAATPTTGEAGVPLLTWQRQNRTQVVLMEPVLFFLPEHAEGPWQTAAGGELWAEVTVPKKGPPRPIRLAVKRGDTFTPLEIK